MQMPGWRARFGSYGPFMSILVGVARCDMEVRFSTGEFIPLRRREAR
jgi:hypothetical protein